MITRWFSTVRVPRPYPLLSSATVADGSGVRAGCEIGPTLQPASFGTLPRWSDHRPLQRVRTRIHRYSATPFQFISGFLSPPPWASCRGGQCMSRAGPYCGSCATGYYKKGKVCAECDGNTRNIMYDPCCSFSLDRSGNLEGNLSAPDATRARTSSQLCGTNEPATAELN
jgi:hypothetical protein